MGAPDWWPGPTLNGSMLGFREALAMVEALQRHLLVLVAKNRAEPCSFWRDRVVEMNHLIEALRPEGDHRFSREFYRACYRKARRAARDD